MTYLAEVLCFVVLGGISIVDICSRKIPHSLLFLLFACGYMRRYAPEYSVVAGFAAMLIVGLPLLLFAAHTDIMGGGDVKLCAVAAFCGGAQSALLALSGACALMALYAYCTRRHSLPFAPFFTFCYIFTMQIFKI